MYKIVAVSMNSKGELEYSFTDNFKAFQASDAGSAYKDLTIDNYLAYEASSDDINQLIGTYSAYAKANSISADYTATTETKTTVGSTTYYYAEFDNVGLGLYAVISDGNANNALIYQNVTATVAPSAVDGKYVVYDEYEVYMKTSEPTITKTATDTNNKAFTNGVTNLQQIKYTITVTVPKFPEGATNTTFYVKDIPSPGVTILTNIACVDVYVDKNIDGTAGWYSSDYSGNYELSDDAGIYTVTFSEGNLYVDFDYESIKECNTITITYMAIINENAYGIVGEAMENTAKLIYANSPFVGTTYDPTGDEDRPTEDTPGYGVKTDTADVYTYGVVVHKTDSETGEGLEGAVFEIYNDENSNFRIGTLTTGSNGYGAFVGLAYGTYYLKEVTAPVGYTISNEVTEFTISDESVMSNYYLSATITYESNISSGSAYSGAYVYDAQSKNNNGQLLYMGGWASTTGQCTDSKYSPAYTGSVVLTATPTDNSYSGVALPTIEITNTAGKSLPGTGGIGVVPFIAVGSVLMIGAVVVLVTRKRMRDVQQG
jgi:LPXTG-motif cell wall-anchored protein